MKKIITLALILSLCLTMAVSFISCDKGGETAGTTADTKADAPTEAPTAAPTEAPTDATTEAPTEGDTEAPTEGETKVSRDDYPSDQYVVIESAEDLMAFNKACNEDYEDYSDMTVIFLADVDLDGYEWVPLDGSCFMDTTFDGQGHTIKHMTINYNTERDITGTEDMLGCGFIGNLPGGCDIVFKDINFDECYITARERHVGCLLGRSLGGCVDFENVSVTNFTVDGWCDYNNTSEDTDGYPICFRVAGVMGGNWGGYHTFTNVTVKNLKISGFHNLAGIVGYDGTGQIDEFCFENCKVEDAEMIFSYCLGASYTVDMPRKFVSVFYNGANWIDNIDECVENGNSYAGIRFLDWTDDLHEYSPADFRSWTAEEAGQ